MRSRDPVQDILRSEAYSDHIMYSLILCVPDNGAIHTCVKVYRSLTNYTYNPFNPITWYNPTGGMLGGRHVQCKCLVEIWLFVSITAYRTQSISIVVWLFCQLDICEIKQSRILAKGPGVRISYSCSWQMCNKQLTPRSSMIQKSYLKNWFLKKHNAYLAMWACQAGNCITLITPGWWTQSLHSDGPKHSVHLSPLVDGLGGGRGLY